MACKIRYDDVEPEVDDADADHSDAGAVALDIGLGVVGFAVKNQAPLIDWGLMAFAAWGLWKEYEIAQYDAEARE